MSATAADPGDRTLVRLVLVVVAALVLVPVLVMALAMPFGGMMGGWWHGGTTGSVPWWGLVMPLVWLLVLVGLGYLAYRAVVGADGSSRRRDDALETLRVAYARGELTDEEFERRREVLAADRDDR